MNATHSGNGTKKMIAALLSISLVYVGEIVGAVISALFGTDFDLSYLICSSVVAVAMIVLLGGKSYLKLDGRAILESFKHMWWIVLLSAILMGWDLYDYIAAGYTPSPGWVSRSLYAVVLCFFIGVSEEGMFRGLLYGGTLARFGDKRKTLMWATIITSLAFGFAHVTAEDFNFENPLTIVQALLKVTQTGMYAVMLCAAMLRSKSLIGPMLVHGFDDWLLFVVSSGLFEEGFETVYVVEDTEEAMSTIIFYVVICVLYLPTFIKSIRVLLKMELPQYGPFMSEVAALPAGEGIDQAYVYPPAPPADVYGAYGYVQQAPQPQLQQPQQWAAQPQQTWQQEQVQQPQQWVAQPQPQQTWQAQQQDPQQWGPQQPAQPQQQWQPQQQEYQWPAQPQQQWIAEQPDPSQRIIQKAYQQPRPVVPQPTQTPTGADGRPPAPTGL